MSSEKRMLGSMMALINSKDLAGLQVIKEDGLCASFVTDVLAKSLDANTRIE